MLAETITPPAPPTDALRNRAFWAALNPDLHLSDRGFHADFDPLPLSAEKRDAWAARLREEGYVQDHVDWGLDLARMAEVVRDLSARGLSPVFAFLYDEFWYVFHLLHDHYRGLLGDDYRLLPDFWVWNVDPAKGEAGWKPHRDKGARSLFADGRPKSLTTWIPLSEATPLNGCMYVVPAHLDPTYGTEREKDWRIEFPSIRALPGRPGDVFMWNQAVLHWGGRTSPRAAGTRVSMAFEFQRADVAPFNEPLIGPLSVLSFETRLRLCAKQILQYRHMYRVSDAMAAFARDLQQG